MHVCTAEFFLVRHTLPQGTVIRSSDLAADGGLVLAGGIDDDLIYIDRLDAAGNRSWGKALDVRRDYSVGPTYHQPAFSHDAACLPDGRIMLVGQAGILNYDTCQYPTRHFVVPGNDGTIELDRTEYGNARQERWNSVLPLSNGTVLLSGGVCITASRSGISWSMIWKRIRS